MVRLDQAPDLVSVNDNSLVTVNYDWEEMEIVSYNHDNKKIRDGVNSILSKELHSKLATLEE